MKAPRIARVAAVATALLAASASHASAATEHVDILSLGGACTDARTAVQAQSPATPWCTVGRALALAPAGSTVEVRRGTYPAASVTGRHLTAGIGVVAFTGERPLIKTLSVSNSDRFSFTGLGLNGGNLTTVTSTSLVGNEIARAGLFLKTSRNVRFQGNVFHDGADALVLRNSSDLTIAGNTFRDIHRQGSAGGDGIQASFITRAAITANSFLFISNPLGHSDAIEILGTNDFVAIDGNVFHAVRGPIVAPGSGTVSPRTSHLTVTNNDLTQLSNWALNIANAPAASIVNNTIWDAGHGLQLRGGLTKASLFNNVISVLDPATGTVAADDFNLIASGPVRGAHDLRGDPRFAVPGLRDYRLTAASPAVDAGSAAVAPPLHMLGRPRVNFRVPGGPPVPDLGAYELQR